MGLITHNNDVDITGYLSVSGNLYAGGNVYDNNEILATKSYVDTLAEGLNTITTSTTTDLTGFIFGDGTSISANDAPSDGKKYVRRNAQWVEFDFAVPVNTVAPTITGTTTIGSTISATNGTWSNSPTSYRYQWQKDRKSVV